MTVILIADQKHTADFMRMHLGKVKYDVIRAGSWG